MKRLASLVAILAFLTWLALLPAAISGQESQNPAVARTVIFLALIVAGSMAATGRRKG